MPTEIIRQQSPEEAELLRKREELSAVRAQLAERELELADLRSQLKSFEGRYLRQVGVLYAELDETDAKIAELEATLDPSASAKRSAQEARKRAQETHEAAHGEASEAKDFRPSADLKSLFREVAKRVHPDFAKDDADQARRTGLMADANDAYNRGDAEALRRILDEYDEDSEKVKGEGIGGELVRIIRQIHHAKINIARIERELATLHASEIAELRKNAEAAEQQGRDLLAELAVSVGEQVARAKRELEALSEEARKSGR